MSSRRTAEELSDALLLLHLSDSTATTSHVSPHAAKPSPAKTSNCASDSRLGIGSEEWEEQLSADFLRAVHRNRMRARFNRSDPTTRPNGARYMSSTGRLEDPPFVAQSIHTVDDNVDKSEEERYEGSEVEGAGFIDQAPWQVGNPMPKTYDVPIAGGRTEQRSLNFTIDFTSAASVHAVNKTRRLAVWRQKKNLGLAMSRPSTRDRQYTQRNDDMIATMHHDYARQNGGYRIPHAELANRYAQAFPGENRSESSISSHIAHVPKLKEMREQCPKRR